ncbi:MAG: hypothetical protein LKI59_00075 [Bacteroidales bacterium]|jgi:hypothetical protein|nr:hypothetical protein [Bacteroidales bacterium]
MTQKSEYANEDIYYFNEETNRFMKYRRVVFRLNDGRCKYATHKGEILLWEQCEIQALRENIRRFGSPCFSNDFKVYASHLAEYRERCPTGSFIRVSGIYTEVLGSPINPEAII